MADMTSEARVIALDGPWPGDVGDLLDIAFGWADFTRLRRMVASQCAAVGLSGSRLDDFVLAIHEISANAIMHAGGGGRLILRRAADGLRCLICDRVLPGGEDAAPPGRIPRARDGAGHLGASGTAAFGPAQADALDLDETDEPNCAESGRGLWLAAQLTDELSITSGPDSTIVSLYVRFE